MIFTLALSSIAYAQSTGSSGSTTGSSNNCTTLLSPDSAAVTSGCGGFSTPSNSSIKSLLNEIPALVKSLDKVCNPTCLGAVNQLAADYSSSTCAAQIVDPTSGLTGSLVGTVYSIVTAITCTKVGSDYCLVSQSATLLPLLQNVNDSDASSIIQAITPLAANQSFLCSQCFVNQLAAVSQIKNPDPTIATYLPLLANLTSSCKTIATNGTNGTTSTSTTKNGAQSFSAAGLTAVLFVAAFALF